MAKINVTASLTTTYEPFEFDTDDNSPDSEEDQAKTAAQARQSSGELTVSAEDWDIETETVMPPTAGGETTEDGTETESETEEDME